MKLKWDGDNYVIELESSRECHLIREAIIEADYVIHALSEAEYVARYGYTQREMNVFSDRWRDFRRCQTLSVSEVELVKRCLEEVIYFFSDNEFHMRTGWEKNDASLALDRLLRDRKRITIRRQWGSVSG